MRLFFLAGVFVCLVFSNVAQTQNAVQAGLLRQILELPAPPPVDDAPGENPGNKTIEREPSFYDRDKVPADDAPIEELFDYWRAQSGKSATPRNKPSEKTLARLLDFCEKEPEAVVSILSILPPAPEVAESLKRFRDKITENENADLTQLDNWLLYNSTYFIEELVKKAEKVKDRDEYVINQRELLALARVDWDRASPILERLIDDKSQPVSATLALWAYYARAMKNDDSAGITKYRRLLQDAVEDRRLVPGARDLAYDALVTEKEWDGRDEWYTTLLSDETLFDLKVNGRSFTGLTTLILYSPPEKYVKTMAKLVESKNPTVRHAAIRNLLSALSGGSAEAARALLPWASNPNWIGDYKDGRSAFITALSRIDMPESVPALIDILMNEEGHRQSLAQALGRYKDPRAVPALKAALADEKRIFDRRLLIQALDQCGGLTDNEKMSSLELFAATTSTPERAQKFYQDLYTPSPETEGDSPNLMPVTLNIGHYVAEQTEPSDGLVIRAIERLKVLRKTKPEVALSLSKIMQKWRGRVILAEKIRQLRTNEADLDTILSLLAQRAEIRVKAENEIFALRTAGGLARGLAACLAEDAADLSSVLQQPDTDARIALLGCARLLRLKLPVAEIGGLLKNQNKTLALAAERYLESEDGPEARTLVLAHKPGEAVILGARQAFAPGGKSLAFNESLAQIFQSVSRRWLDTTSFSPMEKNETNLRDEIKSNPDLLAVYAILPNQLPGQTVIRVFKDRVVFTNYEDAARYRERILTRKEYEDFYRLLIDEKIDTAKPHFAYCDGCESLEFVMFGKNGGRRVFFTNNLDEKTPLKKIVERISSFNEGNLKLHYRLSEKVKGLEILLADENFMARAVWKNGSDWRVLVEDRKKEEEIQKSLAEQYEAEEKIEFEEYGSEQYRQILEARTKRHSESKYAHFGWRGFADGELGAFLAQPAEVPYLFDETQFPATHGFDTEPRAWQVRAGEYEIRAAHGDKSGLYKVNRSQPPVLFKEGNYDFPIVTAGGNWVIATKGAEDASRPATIVRIDLRTGNEYPVNMQPADTFRPITFIAAQNKVLLYRAKGRTNYNRRGEEESEIDRPEKPAQAVPLEDVQNPSPPSPEYYLLDAATGAARLVKGEFRPFEDMTFRALQPAGAPTVFWAAVYDQKAKETTIGRYDAKTFALQSVLNLPEIKLNSMDIWIDEKDSKVFFVYEGHLLSAPLPNRQK